MISAEGQYVSFYRETHLQLNLMHVIERVITFQWQSVNETKSPTTLILSAIKVISSIRQPCNNRPRAFHCSHTASFSYYELWRFLLVIFKGQSLLRFDKVQQCYLIHQGQVNNNREYTAQQNMQQNKQMRDLKCSSCLAEVKSRLLWCWVGWAGVQVRRWLVWDTGGRSVILTDKHAHNPVGMNEHSGKYPGVDINEDTRTPGANQIPWLMM